MRKRLDGVYRADTGFSGPTRQYVLIVALLVGLASVPTLAAITAGSNELADGRTDTMDVPFLPPASPGPVRTYPAPLPSSSPSEPASSWPSSSASSSAGSASASPSARGASRGAARAARKGARIGTAGRRRRPPAPAGKRGPGAPGGGGPFLARP